MINKKYFIQGKPVFPFLLCIFFVFHGFIENYDFVPVKDALLLTGFYLLVTILITGLAWLFYKDLVKACLVAFFTMLYFFFFGAVHDLLKNIFNGAFITRYSFLLPLSIIIFLFIIIFLKRKKKPLFKTTYYLNVLFIFLIFFDSAWLATRIIMAHKKETNDLPREFIIVANIPKPDIYLIVADEYAGNSELKDIFAFDNTPFTDSLKQKGFHTIPYSRSNYNYTPFAGASLLNMNYLEIKNKERGQTDLAYCYKTISENKLLRFLRYNDYSFYNYSIFDFPGQPARVNETFIPVKTRLITSQTFLNRLNRDIRFNLITRLKSKSELKKLTYSNLHNNNNIYNLTRNIVEEKTVNPKFVYAHLMMPHYPYYFDKNGNEIPFEKLVEGNQSNQGDYIEYLQFCNKKILSLIDHILQSSPSPPIIILMGDHGFRHFRKPVENDYYFLNHLSVYLPNQNYSAFPDSLTSVNLFRVILNTEFQQRLSLSKDSTIYLQD